VYIQKVTKAKNQVDFAWPIILAVNSTATLNRISKAGFVFSTQGNAATILTNY